MRELYYHATKPENLESIMRDGIRRGFDGTVYLCKDPADAAKFLAIRLEPKAIVFEVEVESDDVRESFDHSEEFFKCKAYTVDYPIAPNDILNVYAYNFGGRNL